MEVTRGRVCHLWTLCCPHVLPEAPFLLRASSRSYHTAVPLLYLQQLSREPRGAALSPPRLPHLPVVVAVGGWQRPQGMTGCGQSGREAASGSPLLAAPQLRDWQNLSLSLPGSGYQHREHQLNVLKDGERLLEAMQAEGPAVHPSSH